MVCRNGDANGCVRSVEAAAADVAAFTATRCGVHVSPAVVLATRPRAARPVAIRCASRGPATPGSLCRRMLRPAQATTPAGRPGQAGPRAPAPLHRQPRNFRSDVCTTVGRAMVLRRASVSAEPPLALGPSADRRDAPVVQRRDGRRRRRRQRRGCGADGATAPTSAPTPTRACEPTAEVASGRRPAAGASVGSATPRRVRHQGRRPWALHRMLHRRPRTSTGLCRVRTAVAIDGLIARIGTLPAQRIVVAVATRSLFPSALRRHLRSIRFCIVTLRGQRSGRSQIPPDIGHRTCSQLFGSTILPGHVARLQ